MRKALRQAGWALAVAGGIACTHPAPAQTITTTVIPVAGPGAAAAAPAADAASAAETRIDQAMVELAWMADPALFTCSLSGQVDRGCLVVRGYVPNTAVRERALKIARESSNYKVVDRIAVHPGLASRVSIQKPDAITREARAVLEECFPDDARYMEAHADARGRVVLTGSVNSFDDKVLVSRKLRRVAGCSCVDNQLNVVGTSQERVVVTPAPAAAAPAPVPGTTLPMPSRQVPSQTVSRQAVPAPLPILSRPPVTGTTVPYQRIEAPAAMPEVPPRAPAAPVTPPAPVLPGKAISSTVTPAPAGSEVKPVQILTRPAGAGPSLGGAAPPPGGTSSLSSPGASMSQRRAALNASVPGAMGYSVAPAAPAPTPAARTVVPVSASAPVYNTPAPTAAVTQAAYPAASLTPPPSLRSTVTPPAPPPPTAPVNYHEVTAKTPPGNGAYVTTGVVTISYDEPAPPRPAVAPAPAPVGVAQPVQPGPAQLKKKIEGACGSAARQVQVFTRGPKNLQIHITVRTEKDGQAVSDKVLVLPELAPYEVDLAVDVKP